MDVKGNNEQSYELQHGNYLLLLKCSYHISSSSSSSSSSSYSFSAYSISCQSPPSKITNTHNSQDVLYLLSLYTWLPAHSSMKWSTHFLQSKWASRRFTAQPTPVMVALNRLNVRYTEDVRYLLQTLATAFRQENYISIRSSYGGVDYAVRRGPLTFLFAVRRIDCSCGRYIEAGYLSH